MPPATTSAQALQQLQQYQSGIKSPDQVIQDTNNQLGVPAAQQQVTGLRGAIQQTTNLLNNVAPSVMGRTGNSLVTSAQASRLIGNEQQPIQDNLTHLGTQYDTASKDYSDLLGQAQSRANATLGAQQGQLSYLQQLYKDLQDSEQAQRDEAFRQATLAEQVATRKASGSGVGGLSGGLASLLGGAPGGGGSAPDINSIMKLNSQDAVKSLFSGYNPAQDKYYTENTVIPALTQYFAGRNPKLGDQAKAMAMNLAYNYRKRAFGE